MICIRESGGGLVFDTASTCGTMRMSWNDVWVESTLISGEMVK